jgi:hypothetical protein
MTGPMGKPSQPGVLRLLSLPKDKLSVTGTNLLRAKDRLHAERRRIILPNPGIFRVRANSCNLDWRTSLLHPE